MTLNSRGFRDALGHFATGVAVISATGPDGAAIGVTINSFASVSLDPPLVLWSLDKSSDRFRVLMQVENFGVNLLGQAEMDISRRLSRKGESVLGDDEMRKGHHGVPMLKHAIASLECAVHERIEAGDHVIFIGRVLHSAHDSHEQPLLYYRGAYRSLAPKG
jgi:flavin reductase (DIM6/NTAB) family NADH-FMN oxidoreductase RutF